jgi:hypothetical protein
LAVRAGLECRRLTVGLNRLQRPSRRPVDRHPRRQAQPKALKFMMIPGTRAVATRERHHDLGHNGRVGDDA